MWEFLPEASLPSKRKQKMMRVKWEETYILVLNCELNNTNIFYLFD